MSFYLLDAADRGALDTTILGVPPIQWASRKVGKFALPSHFFVDRRVETWSIAPVPLQLSPVAFGNVLFIDKCSELGLDLVLVEDVDFGHRDGVKPSLDPAPNRREEEWSSDNLKCQLLALYYLG